MRIIKFRGRCAFSGTWRYGFYYVSKGNHIIRNEKDRESIILEKTIGQFTGLHDKNGKEIYEGDVVNWGMHHPNSEERFHRYAIVEFNPDIQFKIIFYINSQNGVKKETDGHIFRFGQFAYKETERHLQVLGNIYENPELLTD